MQFCRHRPPQMSTSVVSIGSFDGIHLGHQCILSNLKKVSENFQIPAWVLTFSPSPKAFFGRMGQGQLLSRRDKLERLRDMGVDGVWMPPFDANMARLSPRQFIDDLLLKQMGTRAIVIGTDFRFGYQRTGTPDDFRSAGIEVFHPTPVEESGEWVSSSRIREALAAGDFDLVRSLLGREYTLSGHVSHGAERGRQMGFPTANIVLRFEPPMKGVFVIETQWRNKTIVGLANVGTRPTFDGEKRLCEAHFFDFDENLYGANLTVTFLHKIRDEKKFSGMDALVKQINADVTTAKQILSKQL